MHRPQPAAESVMSSSVLSVYLSCPGRGKQPRQEGNKPVESNPGTPAWKSAALATQPRVHIP